MRRIAQSSRRWFVVAGYAILVILILAGCDLWGALTNPNDENSDQYQGYLIVSSPDKILPHAPADTLSTPTIPEEFLVSRVVDADAYQLQICARADFSGTLAWDKADYPTHRFAATGADLQSGGTWYWRARAHAADRWGRWTTVRSFVMPQKYRVIYHGNGHTGGSVPVDGNYYLPGSNVTVLGNTGSLVRTGYDFNGWNTNAEGTGTDRAPGSDFVMGSADVVLYAQWIPPFISMVSVAGGSFQMGSPAGTGYDDERPVHTVNISSFFMSKYEVTQEQYRTVTGSSPSNFSGTDLPVEQVTWYDAVEFCNTLSEREGLQKVYTITGRTPSSGYPITSATVTMDITKNGYRLPTEAEWEYAARGGNGTPGNYTYSGSDDINEVAWYDGNSGYTTHTVGTKAHNGLGLYDMSGNVWEWCWDWYAGYPSVSQTNPTGASSGTYCVIRGGGWFNAAGGCRSSIRFYYSPGSHGGIIGHLGFRLVRRP